MGAEVIGYEGNLYFQPEAVNQAALRVTDRTYTCPYKGTCNWVDYQGADGGCRAGRGLGLSQGQAGARGHPGSIRILRRRPRRHAHGGGLRVDRPVRADRPRRNLNSFGGEAIRAL